MTHSYGGVYPIAPLSERCARGDSGQGVSQEIQIRGIGLANLPPDIGELSDVSFFGFHSRDRNPGGFCSGLLAGTTRLKLRKELGKRAEPGERYFAPIQFRVFCAFAPSILILSSLLHLCPDIVWA